MRFALWSVVSTRQQAAKDKLSIEVQLEDGRKAAVSRAWIETAGPFVARGASRSFYVNLRDAEADIPELAKMLEAARLRAFDVLVIYSYDRLGDLADMIAQTLRFYGVQIYSVSQPIEPQSPDQFDPYAADAEDNMRDVHRITQRFRIADLRRKWRKHVPARAKRGLPPLSITFGYRHTSDKTPPELIQPQAGLLVQMKNWFLQGVNMTEIARRAQASGISPRRSGTWHRQVILRMLTNPFYAGLTVFGRQQDVRDTRANQKKRVVMPESQWIVGPGQHQPLWDESTWRAILAEAERRRSHGVSSANRFTLSGLLTCSICGQVLARHNGSIMGRRAHTLSCRSGKAHVIIEYDLAVRLLAVALRDGLSSAAAAPVTVKPQDDSKLRAALKDLTSRRQLVQEGYEGGLYTKSEALTRLDEIDRLSAETTDQIERRQTITRQRQEIQSLLSNLGDLLPSLHDYLTDREPHIVQRILTTLCEKITVSPDYEFTIHWRA